MKKVEDTNFHNYLLCGENFDVSDNMLETSTWEDYYIKMQTYHRTGKEKEKQYEDLKK
jgi:hypothetical protein